MTGGQFQNLIASTGCFQPVHNCTMAFINKNGKPIHVNSQWNRRDSVYYEKVSVSLNYHTDRSVWIDFIFCSKNIYASHNLKDLDFNLFTIEINKFLRGNSTWDNWLKINKRDYLIKEALK